ncbi:ABC transporter substrate-binding protein [Amphritea japonica]|uniref:ABC transporter substrate-binding protein n=1 Tax=Amphritea japonica ATCC BAA-1530 TaxID=1278309 RepID=A0A7R6PQE6_9GAMM|nr:ABC transporter substrate binding protein [Amphritea japonica]BBB27613.1 ABC transporter substrate-binding protein [Amphritea japonica ATCC BAA-1530]
MPFIRSMCVIILCCLTVPAALGEAYVDKGVFSTKPVMNGDQRWRIGYFEGGEYIDYQKILIETVKGLMQTGWIDKAEIPDQEGEQTALLWQWLQDEVKSEFVEFVDGAHYSAQWHEAQRDRMAEGIIARLNNENDIDLMIAMGTWAGKALSSDRHDTPTMVLSASDPLAAGIIKSVEDSGFEHIHATLDPNRYERQVRVFHDIVNFKTLGVAYEDSDNGRSYAALDVIENLSQERGFKVARCFTLSDITDTGKAEESVIKCFKKLAPKVDAIYVTVQGGVTGKSIGQLVDIANKHRVPTFSQSGSEEVSKGLLLSLSQAGFRYVGEFHASTFAKVFNGALPNQLTQLFEEPPRMAVNLKTAEVVGFNPPLLLLGAADEVYRDIPEE